MTSPKEILIMDGTSPTGHSLLQEGDRIATSSMPHRPITVTRIIAGGDDPMVAGNFAKSGATIFGAKQLAKAFLVKRKEPELVLQAPPGATCDHTTFKKWYESLGAKPHCLQQSYWDHQQGQNICSPTYWRKLTAAGIEVPFDKDASSKQGAQAVAVNENVRHDDPYPAADCTKTELAVWLGAHWGLKLTEEMELYHRSGWNVSSDEYRDMIEHQYDDMEDGGTQAA